MDASGVLAAEAGGMASWLLAGVSVDGVSTIRGCCTEEGVLTIFGIVSEQFGTMLDNSGYRARHFRGGA